MGLISRVSSRTYRLEKMNLNQDERKIFVGGLILGTVFGTTVGWTLHRLRRTYLDKKRDLLAKYLKKTEDAIKRDNLVDTKSSTSPEKHYILTFCVFKNCN